MEASKIWSIAKKRGFVWASSEIYGGVAGFYDYAHLGAAIKRKFEELWLKYFLRLGDYYFIETSDILPAKCLKASGHEEYFTDILVECEKCKNSFKADLLIEEHTGKSAEALTVSEINEQLKLLSLKCPECKSTSLGEATPFNMMFPVNIGTKQAERAYLRPETAQGVYLNFKREFEALRKKLPLGLAIIGKAYRNEISPRQGMYRLRELTQAELQIFFEPEKFDEQINFEEVEDYKIRLQFVEDREENKIAAIPCKELVRKLPKYYIYHLAKCQQFYLDVLKVPEQKFRFFEKSEKERAFYTKIHFDLELNLETLGGFKEVAGIHYRSDYDLRRHQEHSGEKLEVNIEGKKLIPHVLELSFGVDRNVWALFDLFFYEEKGRTILKLPAPLAPYLVGVFPLVNKDNLPERATEIYKALRKKFDVFYDESGSIGRRYARMDEIGTPFGITIDYQTFEDNTVTIRERDTTKQVRVKVDDLAQVVRALLEGEIKFEGLP
ncbi:MAG: glycine--tRNA ligase [Candidatus Thermoplasmatota archaeon]